MSFVTADNMLQTILTKCSRRSCAHNHEQCMDCTYGTYCEHNCEKCLDYIHFPSHAKKGAPERKYDCTHMADFYTCKYSCRYASEIVYAVKRCKKLATLSDLKVLSFGCGPCTDLLAIDYLRSQGDLSYHTLEYRGIDYSQMVWKHIHRDIKAFENDRQKIQFYYKDACEIIHDVARGSWTPNVIVFQYVFSDMKKHTDLQQIREFIATFADYYNSKVCANTYVILNDVNLSTQYNGGRDFFDELYRKLENSSCKKGRFCNDNSTSDYYPRGYPYGTEEFPCNANFFDITQWNAYSPFDTCASAQMLICKG